MPRTERHFLAPLLFELDPDDLAFHRGRSHIHPGVSSMLPCRDMPKGMRCHYPPGQLIEVVDEHTPPHWPRRTVVEVPNKQADRGRVYAWLTITGDLQIAGPDQVALVVDEDDPSVRDAWQRITFALVDPGDLERLGGPEQYPASGLGVFYPENYRITCTFRADMGKDVPRTWVEYRPRQGQPFPLPGIDGLALADRARLQVGGAR